MAEDAFTTVDARDQGLPNAERQAPAIEAEPSEFIPSEEWVTTKLLPILIALSRRGVIITYDSGVQFLNRGV